MCDNGIVNIKKLIIENIINKNPKSFPPANKIAPVAKPNPTNPILNLLKIFLILNYLLFPMP